VALLTAISDREFAFCAPRTRLRGAPSKVRCVVRTCGRLSPSPSFRAASKRTVIARPLYGGQHRRPRPARPPTRPPRSMFSDGRRRGLGSRDCGLDIVEIIAAPLIPPEVDAAAPSFIAAAEDSTSIQWWAWPLMFGISAVVLFYIAVSGLDPPRPPTLRQGLASATRRHGDRGSALAGLSSTDVRCRFRAIGLDERSAAPARFPSEARTADASVDSRGRDETGSI
jgi:hypothetical protein